MDGLAPPESPLAAAPHSHFVRTDRMSTVSRRPSSPSRLPSSRAVPLLVPGLLAAVLAARAAAQDAAQKSEPTFTDGEAQIVEGFKDPKSWVREELWVEAEFDTDGDGAKDRMHVDVTRPKQTDSEGLKVAVIYETSPYFSGVGSTESKYFWDPHQEVHGKPKPREHMPSIEVRARAGRISEDLVADWVPRGFAVVHSESPGTGLSQGCP